MHPREEWVSVFFSTDSQNLRDCWISEGTHLLNLESAERAHCSIWRLQMVEIPLRWLNCRDHTSPQNLEDMLHKSQGDWSREDNVQLLECKNKQTNKKIPSSDKHMFKITESVTDWGKGACKEFSGEMYKFKWSEISRNVRKLHTLTELVLGAKRNVNNHSKSRNHKKHLDLPKNPWQLISAFLKRWELSTSKNTPRWATRSWPRARSL